MKKKEKHVYLAAIRRDLQARYQYKSREKRNWAFRTFWFGWMQKRMRQTHCAPQTYYKKWKQGWLNEALAEDFWDYITQ